MADRSVLQELMPRPSNVFYYDMDDIISMQEKVPVQFERPCYRLGFLDVSSADQHIKQGTKMEVPCWLAFGLCTQKHKITSVELPKTYNESHREIYKADALVLDLHKFGPYFYKFGMKLLHFQHVDSAFVARSLLQVFVQRFRKIMDSSQNASHQEDVIIKQKLDELEINLFDNGHKSSQDYLNWQQGLVGKLTVSKAISLQRKRKRTMDD